MSWLRATRPLIAVVAVAAWCVPLVALLLMALGVGDSTGRTLSLFPVAFWLLDPATWSVVGTSVLVASLIALLARVMGVALARLLVRTRYWGRPVAALLCVLPGLWPPLLGSIGLHRVLNKGVIDPWFTPGGSVWAFWNHDVGTGYVIWIWAELVSQVLVVAILVSRPLSLVDRGWTDAALAAGARRRQVWRTVVRPLIRPAASRAMALSFALTLLEPSVPLLLGLRRTLGFQIVSECMGGGRLDRAAVLCLIGLGVIAVVCLVARLLSGSRPAWSASSEERDPRGVVSAPWWQAALMLGTLGAWLAMAWLPLLCLGQGLFAADGQAALRRLALLTSDAEIRMSLRVSCLTGVGSALLAIALAQLTRPDRMDQRRWLRDGGLLGAMGLHASMVLAVGLACLPAALNAFADLAGPGWLDASWSNALRSLALVFDPVLSPGLAVVLALGAAQYPLAHALIAGLHQPDRVAWIEAGRLLGATRSRAWWHHVRRWVLAPAAAVLLLCTIRAGGDAGIALVLMPRPEFSPLGPTWIRLADDPRVESLGLVWIVVTAIVMVLCVPALLRTRR